MLVQRLVRNASPLVRRVAGVIGPLEMLGLAGCAAVTYGAWTISPTLAWLAGGSLAIGVAVLGARGPG